MNLDLPFKPTSSPKHKLIRTQVSSTLARRLNQASLLASSPPVKLPTPFVDSLTPWVVTIRTK